MNQTVALGLCLMLVALPAFSDGASIRAREAWLRAPSGQADVAAGYLTLENAGPDDRLIAAESPAVERVEIHDVTFENGVMKMREAKQGLPIARGALLTLKPRSAHLMLVRPRTKLIEGQTVRVTLRFAHASALDINLSVLSATAAGPTGSPTP